MTAETWLAMSEAQSSIMTICRIVRILASMASLVVPSKFLSSSSLKPERSLGGRGGGTTAQIDFTVKIIDFLFNNN